MQIFYLLPALLILLAVILWYTQAHTPVPVPPDDPPKPEADACGIESLTAAVTVLQELMEHPVLGGPGYLTVRFQDGSAAVTVQYPNIQEALYRHIIRQELSPGELLPEGFPGLLLELSPEFEVESGGMVLVTVPVPALTQDASSHHSRQVVLDALLAELRPRFPGLSIRILGGELILTPIREMADI